MDDPSRPTLKPQPQSNIPPRRLAVEFVNVGCLESGAAHLLGERSVIARIFVARQRKFAPALK